MDGFAVTTTSSGADLGQIHRNSQKIKSYANPQNNFKSVNFASLITLDNKDTATLFLAIQTS